MEKYMPFESGKAYAPIDGRYEGSWLSDIYSGQVPVVSLSTYYATSSVRYPSFDSSDIQHFYPDAFLEKSQTVKGTILVKINEEVDQLVNEDGYGIRFNRLRRDERKIMRISIPVEEFIKKFEIVL